MAAYVPPGWPPGVHPPGSEHFERTAIAWLLDVVPPDYRLYGVLRRHPVALATMARHHLAACVEGARRGYRTTRTELGGGIPPHALDAVLAAYRSEGRRLVETARAVDLVARALAGEEFPPQLQDEPRPAPAPGADARQPAPAHLSGPAPAPASEPASQPPPTIAGRPAAPQRRARTASKAKHPEGKRQSAARRASETSAPDPDSRRSSPERAGKKAAARPR